MTTIYGYARVSSNDQDLTIQEQALKAAGATIIRSEKRSGTTTKGRDELETILAFAKPGDTLMVTRIDRLARSMADLAIIGQRLKENGIELKATEQNVDTSTPAGRAFFQMLGVFAEFETAIRRERQLEGIAAAKADGRYKGRKPAIDGQKVKQMASEGMGASQIAKALKIGRASVYRYLENAN